MRPAERALRFFCFQRTELVHGPDTFAVPVWERTGREHSTGPCDALPRSVARSIEFPAIGHPFFNRRLAQLDGLIRRASGKDRDIAGFKYTLAKFRRKWRTGVRHADRLNGAGTRCRGLGTAASRAVSRASSSSARAADAIAEAAISCIIRRNAAACLFSSVL